MKILGYPVTSQELPRQFLGQMLGMGLSLALSEGQGPADLLASDLQLPQLKDNTCLLFKPLGMQFSVTPGNEEMNLLSSSLYTIHHLILLLIIIIITLPFQYQTSRSFPCRRQEAPWSLQEKDSLSISISLSLLPGKDVKRESKMRQDLGVGSSSLSDTAVHTYTSALNHECTAIHNHVSKDQLQLLCCSRGSVNCYFHPQSLEDCLPACH